MEFVYDLAALDAHIYPFLAQESGFSKTLRTAMNEAVRNGGKRIRPLLILESYKLIKGSADMEILAPFMAALEYIHTFSLIHDDLPCIDNDVLRRGKPSTWVRFGEDMAVLAGDGLSIEAFRIVSAAMAKEKDVELLQRQAKALQILAAKSGIDGMIGGEAVDVEKTGKEIGPEELLYIYRLKTAALLEAAMLIGAVLAGAKESDLLVLESVAEHIGLAFQIKDDILDETSTSEELGKPAGSDESSNKNTYTRIYGIEKAKEDLERHSEEAVSLLRTLSGDTQSLEALIAWLINRKK